MTVWDPSGAIKTAYYLLTKQFGCCSNTSDGSWIVSLWAIESFAKNPERLTASIIRNRLAIPFATTSEQWTHYMLIPDGTRMQVRAINTE